jgi:hypothetical protein
MSARKDLRRQRVVAEKLHFAYYNFCHVYSSLRVTPAMEAGLTDHVWELKDCWLSDLLEIH